MAKSSHSGCPCMDPARHTKATEYGQSRLRHGQQQLDTNIVGQNWSHRLGAVQVQRPFLTKKVEASI